MPCTIAGSSRVKKVRYSALVAEARARCCRRVAVGRCGVGSIGRAAAETKAPSIVVGEAMSTTSPSSGMASTNW